MISGENDAFSFRLFPCFISLKNPGITYNIPAVVGASIPPDPLLEEVLDVYNNNASPWVYWVGSVFTTQKPSLYDDVLSPGMQALYAGQLTPEGLSQMAQDAISQWYPPLMNK